MQENDLYDLMMVDGGNPDSSTNITVETSECILVVRAPHVFAVIIADFYIAVERLIFSVTNTNRLPPRKHVTAQFFWWY